MANTRGWLTDQIGGLRGKIVDTWDAFRAAADKTKAAAGLGATAESALPEITPTAKITTPLSSADIKPEFRVPDATESGLKTAQDASGTAGDVKSLRTANTGANPNIKPGGVSPEAKAFEAARTAQPAAVDAGVGAKAASKAGWISKGLSGLAKVAAPITAAVGSYDALKNGTSNMDQTIAEEITASEKQSHANLSKQFPRIMAANDAIGNALRIGTPEEAEARANAFRGSVINTTRRIGNAFVPNFLVENAGDKVVGGLRDMFNGNALGTTKFDADPQQAAAQTTVENPALRSNESTAAGLAAAQSGSIGNEMPTNQGPQDPRQLLRGNAVPAQGYGAIRNNQTGATQGLGQQQALPPGVPPLPANATKEQAAAWINASNAAIESNNARSLRDQQVQSGGQGPVPQVLQDLVKQGPGGALAAGMAYGATSRLTKNKAEEATKNKALDVAAEGHRLTAATAAAAAARAQANSDRDFNASQQAIRRGTFDTDIKNVATEMAGQPGTKGTFGQGGVDSAGHETKIKNLEASLRTDINHSLGNRRDGKKYEDLNQTEREQLFLAKKFKDKVVDSRGGLANKASNFFGNKRFDSKDLYSFMPSGAEGTVIPFQGGYKIQTQNGNTMFVKQAMGGGFNWTGPNDPVDADLSALVTPHIKRYQDSLKKNNQVNATTGVRG